MRNITIKLIQTELPEGVHGCISGTDADGYIIMIHNQDSAEEQEKTFLHECLHLWRKDTIRKDATVIQIEREAHGIR